MAIQIFENQRSAASDVDEVSWLDGASPAHPLLGDVPGLQTIAGVIKQNLIEHLMARCRVILQSDDQPDQEVSRTDLEESLRREPRVWEAILLAQKYGVIYLMSRAEALHYQDLMQSPNRRQWLEPRKIDCYLRNCSRAIRAMNYAVYSFVTTGGLQVDHPPQLIPPNAISALGPSHIAVRRADFSKSISDILASDIVLYDLHDFAHLSAATVSAELYGSKYFDVLIKLDPSLTALIRSPGYRLATGSMISDGLLFSELLTGIVNPALEVALKRQSNHTYQSLTEVSAEKLAKYLLGLRPLWHPSTASLVKVDAPISPTELAILAQNKAYELPASEIEQLLLTRGGPVGDQRDNFDGMTAQQRIAHLASNRHWTFFEVRNTIKHRAHKLAYLKVALHFIEVGTDADLSRKIADNITYEDWGRGQRLNLWRVVLESEQSKSNVATQ